MVKKEPHDLSLGLRGRRALDWVAFNLDSPVPLQLSLALFLGCMLPRELDGGKERPSKVGRKQHYSYSLFAN